MKYLGDYLAGSTVEIPFTTAAASGAAVAPSSGFEAADVIVYKDHSGTQRTSASGMTMTSPFDSITGLHQLSIDLSDNTDAGFWAAGHDYTIVLSPDTETVDGQTVVAVLAQFSIENRNIKANVTQLNGVSASAAKLERNAAAVNQGLATSGGSTTAIVLNATTGIDGGVPSATDDFYNGRTVIFLTGTLAWQATQITDYVGSTKTLTVVALTGAPASGDTFVIL